MKKSLPLVTIIIPVYNVEKYIEECINSILEQTYSNIEIIAIDDGSTDNSLKILKQYSSDKLYIYKHDKNKGQAAARNLGIEVSNGEYILFVDSDDLIRKDAVEILIMEMQKNDVSLIRFNAISFHDKTNVEFIENAYNSSNYLSEEITYKENNMKDFYLSYTASPVLYIIKRKIISQNEIQFFEGIIHEDELFTSTLYLHISSAKYINKNMYKRRYRENSTMMDKSKKQIRKSFDSYIKIIKEYQEILENKIVDSSKKNFIKYRINSIMYSLYSFSIDGDYKSEELSNIKRKKWYYSQVGKTYFRMLKLLLLIKNKFQKKISK